MTMTREETKEAIEVMQAYADGKVIQWRDTDGEWYDIDGDLEASFNWKDNDYRIKSEPKYRPFANMGELTEAVNIHGIWLKDNHSECSARFMLIYYDNGYVCIGGISDALCFESAYNDYQFADGTTFGVNTEE